MELNDLDLYVFRAICTNVVDGDTVDLDIDLGFRRRTSERIRLSAIDTPERGDAGWHEAKAFVTDLLLNKTCYVKSYKTGNFGRWLGDVYVERPDGLQSVNELLMVYGHAKTYKRG